MFWVSNMHLLVVSVDSNRQSIGYIFDIANKTLHKDDRFSEIIPFHKTYLDRDIGTPNVLYSALKDRVVNIAFVEDDMSLRGFKIVSGLDDKIEI